ncbi:cell division protein [Acinetobacter sp. LoGeW2-3]|uniref:SPOR domain-containing protein n=1 Tax=Acinetobacter sp. LoGeW2-3 TaxID=1808001 RepID=UPI000C05B755|nr:SPOR domain-containing protein [Acinetobacter sp. LoGeW2-3]ATO19043.1 cell division protein [Acinetobacter sp. LoGeW2-3]
MFGKTQRGVSERPNKPKKPLIPAWLGTLVIILIVLSFLVALMLWKPWEPVKPNNDQVTSGHYEEEDSNKDYRFYDLLPKQQVTPIPEQAVPETNKQDAVVIVEAPRTEESTAETATEPGLVESPAVPVTTYILQVRSFDDPDQADARRAEIILNGLSADVVRSVENGKVWYRVVSGPYDSVDAAVIAQQTLQHSGIDSIVVKQ